MTEITLTDDEWTAQYRPLAAPSGSQMWQREEIRDITDAHVVWSWLDGGEGGTYVCNGFHVVNVYAWAVTEVPWLEGDSIEVEIESSEDERARYRAEGIDV